MAKKTITNDKYCTKKQEEFLKGLGEVILKYCKDGIGTIDVDDIDIEVTPINNAWVELSLWFKLIE